jgi:lysine 6-dehydrogenase
MRALVPGGAGAVCKETTRDLAQYSDFEEIVVADYNLEAAQALVEDIGDPRLKAIFFDAGDYEGMLRLFPEYDIVVNGLPFKYNTSVARACVEVGVNGLDLAGDEPQFALHEQAVEKDVLYIPGMGATPGITNLMVRRASEILDRMDKVDIFFAAFRCLAPAPGLLQTTLWEFNPDVEERAEVYFENGAWHATPPLSGGRVIQFHGQIGEQKVYYVPHDESKTLPRSFPTLRRAAVRGCFPPHVMALMGSLMRGGLLSSRPVQIGDGEMPSIEVVRQLLADVPLSRENPTWGYGLVVEVTGERDDRRVKCTYRSKHPPQEEWGGTAAYFKNVGVPLSIGAQLVAHSQNPGAGVLPPEQALPTEPFFTELARRGIAVQEVIVEEGDLA